MLFHPALERVVPASHRLVIPQPLTVCGGPFFAQAVESLRSQAIAAAQH
jgi:iron complex transport system substrate-binding protein